MDIQEAIIKSIRAYYEDNAFSNTNQLKEVRYSKKYFDDFEAELMGETEVKRAPQETKADPEKKAMLNKMMSEQSQELSPEMGDSSPEGSKNV